MVFLHAIGALFVALVMVSCFQADIAGKHVRSELRLACSLADERLNNLLGRHLTSLRLLAANPAVQDYVSGSGETEDGSVLRNSFSSIKPEDGAVVIVDAQGKQMLRSDRLALVDISDRKYFQEVMKGNEAVSDPLMSMAGARTIIVIAVPVRDGKGRVTGLVQKNLPLETFQELVSDFRHGSMRLLLLDRGGKLLADTGMESVSENGRTDLSGQDFVTLAPARAVAFSTVPLDGEDWSVGGVRNGVTGFVIAAALPVFGVYYDGVRMIAWASLGGILALCLAVALGKYLSRRIRPDDGEAIQEYSLPSGGTSAERRVTVVSDGVHVDELDSVTQLLSGDAVVHRCRERLAQSTSGAMSVLYVLELDHFGNLCARKGKEYGDRILREFADRLRRTFRPADLIGRLEGGRFLVFLDGFASTEPMSRKASQIIVTARGICIGEVPVGITASLGYAVSPRDGVGYEDLYAVAVESLERVRSNGRDGYCRRDTAVFH